MQVGQWKDGTAGLTLNPSHLELWNGVNPGQVASQCGETCFDEQCILAANVTRVRHLHNNVVAVPLPQLQKSCKFLPSDLME